MKTRYARHALVLGLLTAAFAVSGCHIVVQGPIPGTPGPGPVPAPSREEVSRQQVMRGVAVRIGVGVMNIANFDSYQLLTPAEISALAEVWREMEPPPPPTEPAASYEEDFVARVRGGIPRAAIGVARLHPPIAAAADYGYEPWRQYSWVVFLESASRFWLVDLRRDLAFLWEETLEGSWVAI
jgi:hypothetical protein